MVDLNPDFPLPSLEEEPARNGLPGAEDHHIPNSQESVDLGAHLERNGGGSQVRPDFLLRRQDQLVQATPPPVAAPSSSAGGSADTFRDKTSAARGALAREIPESSPEPRARSTSVKLRKDAEAGNTSSILPPRDHVTRQIDFTNGSSNHVESGGVTKSRRTSGGKTSSTTRDVYDQIPSGEEGKAVLKAKKAELNKSRKGPANSRTTTPPSLQRTSQDRSKFTPGELPLTPNSRKEAQRQKDEAAKLKRSRMAAAEAAEQRRREALENQRVENARREEQDRIELEERIRTEAEEQRLADEAWLLKDKKQQQEAEDRQIEEGLVEAERLLSNEFEMESAERAEAEKLKEAQKKQEDARLRSVMRLHSTPPTNAQPVKDRPSHLRRSSSALSSTPYIPTGRKSALKSSPILKGSSPALRSPSFTGIGLDQNMPLPRPRERKVSFHGVPDEKETSSRPSIRPQTVVTPHPAAKFKRGTQSLDLDSPEVMSRKGKSITPDTRKSKSVTPHSTLKTSRGSDVGTPDIAIAALLSEKSRTKSITPIQPPKTITPQSSNRIQVIVPSPSKSQRTSSTSSQTIKPGAIAPKSITPVAAPRSVSGAGLPDSKRIVPSVPHWKKARDALKKTESRSASPQVLVSGKIGNTIKAPPVLKPSSQLQTKAQPSAAVAKAKSKSPAVAPEPIVINDAESSSEADESESEVAVVDEVKGRSVTPEVGPSSPVAKRRSSTPKQAPQSPVVIRRSTTPKVKASSPVAPRRSSTPKRGNEAEMETQSRDSSSRDSRSPVIYTQKQHEHQSSVRRQQPSSLAGDRSIQRSEDSSDSESEEDVEMEEPQVVSSKNDDIVAEDDVDMPDVADPPILESPSSSSASNSDSEDAAPPPKLNPRSQKASVPSSQILPIKHSTFQSLVSPSNTPSSCASQDTQDEVDFQLISSLYQASSSAPRSTQAPPTSTPRQQTAVNKAAMKLNGAINKGSLSSPAPTRPPMIGFGASLQGMNAKKSIPSASAPVRSGGRGPSGNGKPLLKSTGRDDSEEESEESDVDSEDGSSSDDNEKLKAKKLVPKLAMSSQQRPAHQSRPQQSSQLAAMMDEPSTSSDSISDSDSDDEDESEKESEAAKIRRNLMAEVAKIHMSQSQAQARRGSMSKSKSPVARKKVGLRK